MKIIPTKDGNIIKLETQINNKLKARELIGEHLGVFTDKLEIGSVVLIHFNNHWVQGHNFIITLFFKN